MMRCDKLHATIRVEQCLVNQGIGSKHNWSVAAHNPCSIPTCRGCETGMMARDGLLSDEDVERMILNAAGKIVASRTNEGGGVEETDQDVASVSGKVLPITDSIEETMTCGKCGESRPILDFYPRNSGGSKRRRQCKYCDKVAIYEWKKKKVSAKKASSVSGSDIGIPILETGGNDAFLNAQRKKEEHGLHSPSPERDFQAPGSVLTIDLGKYPELMEEIKRIAENEDRTPEAQVRYWIRNHLGTKRRQGERYGE